jgi:hypothetical protein
VRDSAGIDNQLGRLRLDLAGQGKTFLVDQASVRDYGSMLSDVANYFQIVGFPLAIAALFLGWLQTRKATQTTRTQTLLTLDGRLNAFEDERAKVNNIESIEAVRLRRYIAAFERVGYALRLKGLPLKAVDNFYGDRFSRLTNYPGTLSIVKGRREAWEEFYYLWEKLYDYKGNKRLLSDPQEAAAPPQNN